MLAVGNAVYFADEEKILIWRDGHFLGDPVPHAATFPGARLHRDRRHRLCHRARSRAVPAGPTIGSKSSPTPRAPARTNHLRWAGRPIALALTAERGFPNHRRARRPVADRGQSLAGWQISPGRNAWATARWRSRLPPSPATAACASAPMARISGPLDNSIGLYVKTLRGFSATARRSGWEQRRA